MFGVSVVDTAAFACFLVCWAGYTLFADHLRRDGRNLFTAMHDYRLRWMERMLERELRIVDVTILATQMRNVSLLASTSIIILGGLLALLGAIDTARSVVAKIPFAVQASAEMWEVKDLALMGVFVYAFFKFAWSLRQFNYATVLIGAAPMPQEEHAPDRKGYAERAARIHTLAGHTFNRGLRAYYFGMATMTWFLHPVLFMVASVWVVVVLYRREFRSFTLRTLLHPDGDPARDG
jgi:uncharacterized membrane protein